MRSHQDPLYNIEHELQQEELESTPCSLLSFPQLLCDCATVLQDLQAFEDDPSSVGLLACVRKRLCARVQLLHEPISHAHLQITNMLDKHILFEYLSHFAELLRILKDVLTYIQDTIRERQPLLQKTLRQAHAQHVHSLTSELANCTDRLGWKQVATLLADKDLQRKEDLEDLSCVFEASLNLVLEELSAGKTSNEEEFDAVRDEISNNGRVLNEIMVSLKHAPLTLDELFKLQDESKEQGRKAQQYHDALMSRFDQLEFLLKCLGNKVLTQDESMQKEKLLATIKIDSSDVVVTSQRVGQGGFGEVYVGYFKGTTKVAVKKLKLEKLNDKTYLDLLQNELLIMNHVGNDPHILTTYGYSMDNQGMQIVMELSTYGALSKVLYDRWTFPHLSVLLCLNWLRDLSLAIDHIHKKQVKHKDIKAENLLLFPGLRVKLCDFGLSKQHHLHQSRTSSAGGTLGFIAPEIINNQKSTFSVDIYSFAMTAVQIFSRGYPSVGEPKTQIDIALETAKDSLPIQTMELLRSLLGQCVLYDPTERKRPDTLRPSSKKLRDGFCDIIVSAGCEVGELVYQSDIADLEKRLIGYDMDDADEDGTVVPLLIRGHYYFFKMNVFKNKIAQLKNNNEDEKLLEVLDQRTTFMESHKLHSVAYERIFPATQKELDLQQQYEHFCYMLSEHIKILRETAETKKDMMKVKTLKHFYCQFMDEFSELSKSLVVKSAINSENIQLTNDVVAKVAEVATLRLQGEKREEEAAERSLYGVEEKGTIELELSASTDQKRKTLEVTRRAEIDKVKVREAQQQSSVGWFGGLFGLWQTNFIASNSTLKVAVKQWREDRAAAAKQYGDISMWDTSHVTNMKDLFKDDKLFNDDISTWNTSSVTDMCGMFYAANSFNADISAWDTQSVSCMRDMFYEATSFNADISAWDTKCVTNMACMLYGATAFNADISTWETRALLDMRGMFYKATTFNADISEWDTKSVYNMAFLFYGATSFNADISAWNTKSVTNMRDLFNRATSFNADISAWDTKSVSDMQAMFLGAVSFNADISAWDTINVKDMKYMFHEATSFTFKDKCKQRWPQAQKQYIG